MNTAVTHSQRRYGRAYGQKRRKISRTGTGGAAATTPPSPPVTDTSARSRSRIPVIHFVGPRNRQKKSPAVWRGFLELRTRYEPLDVLLVELLLVLLLLWLPVLVSDFVV